MKLIKTLYQKGFKKAKIKVDLQNNIELLLSAGEEYNEKLEVLDKTVFNALCLLYPGNDYINQVLIDYEKEKAMVNNDGFNTVIKENTNPETEIWLSIDGEEPCTYAEFYKDNTAEGVEPPDEEEFEAIKSLQIGESHFTGHMGTTEIKRVAGPYSNTGNYETGGQIAAQQSDSLGDYLSRIRLPKITNLGISKQEVDYISAKKVIAQNDALEAAWKKIIIKSVDGFLSRSFDTYGTIEAVKKNIASKPIFWEGLMEERSLFLDPQSMDAKYIDWMAKLLVSGIYGEFELDNRSWNKYLPDSLKSEIEDEFISRGKKKFASMLSNKGFEKGGSIDQLSNPSRYFVEHMLQGKIARKTFTKSNPKYEAQVAGIQDAIKNGFLFVTETPTEMFVRPKPILQDMYFEKGGQVKRGGKLELFWVAKTEFDANVFEKKLDGSAYYAEREGLVFIFPVKEHDIDNTEAGITKEIVDKINVFGHFERHEVSAPHSYAKGGSVESAPSLKLDTKEKIILASVYTSRIEGLKGILAYLKTTSAYRYYFDNNLSLAGAVSDTKKEIEDASSDIKFLNEEGYPPLHDKWDANTFLRELNELVRTSVGRQLFESKEMYNAYLRVYEKMEAFYDEQFGEPAPNFEKGGSLDKDLSWFKKIPDYLNDRPSILEVSQAITQKRVDKLRDAGLSDIDIKAVFWGYQAVFPEIKADTEFSGYPGGIMTMMNEYHDREIDRTADDISKGYYEAGLKYPEIKNWTAICKKFSINTVAKIIETTEKAVDNKPIVVKYAVWTGKGIFLGKVIARDGTDYERPDEIDGGYVGVVCNNIDILNSFLNEFLGYKKNYVKDLNYLRNGLGGIDWDDIEKFGLKFTDQNTPKVGEIAASSNQEIRGSEIAVFEKMLQEKINASTYPQPVKVVEKQKYVLINVGSSGKFMYDKDNGHLYYIKGYGVIDRKKDFGLLSDIVKFDFDWEGYSIVTKGSTKKSGYGFAGPILDKSGQQISKAAQDILKPEWDKMKEFIANNEDEVFERGPLKLSDIPKSVKAFMPVMQQKAIVGNEEVWDVIDRLKKIIDEMPVTYQTEDTTLDEKMVWLHYFFGGSDWYIVEKDMGDFRGQKDPVQHQAFGYAILNGDHQMAEWGYISIEELKSTNKIELDFYFKPIKFGELKKKWEQKEEKKASSGKVYFGDKITPVLENLGFDEVYNELSHVNIFYKGRTFDVQDNSRLKEGYELSYSIFEHANGFEDVMEIGKIKEGEYGSLTELGSNIKTMIDDHIDHGTSIQDAYRLNKANGTKVPVSKIYLFDNRSFATYERADNFLFDLIKQQRHSNCTYKIVFKDGREVAGSIDMEPYSFWEGNTNPFTWHINTYWPNVAKSKALGEAIPQSYIDEAKDIVENYDLGDEVMLAENTAALAGQPIIKNVLKVVSEKADASTLDEFTFWWTQNFILKKGNHQTAKSILKLLNLPETIDIIHIYTAAKNFNGQTNIVNKSPEVVLGRYEYGKAGGVPQGNGQKLLSILKEKYGFTIIHEATKSVDLRKDGNDFFITDDGGEFKLINTQDSEQISYIDYGGLDSKISQFFATPEELAKEINDDYELFYNGNDTTKNEPDYEFVGGRNNSLDYVKFADATICDMWLNQLDLKKRGYEWVSLSPDMVTDKMPKGIYANRGGHFLTKGVFESALNEKGGHIDEPVKIVSEEIIYPNSQNEDKLDIDETWNPEKAKIYKQKYLSNREYIMGKYGIVSDNIDGLGDLYFKFKMGEGALDLTHDARPMSYSPNNYEILKEISQFLKKEPVDYRDYYIWENPSNTKKPVGVYVRDGGMAYQATSIDDAKAWINSRYDDQPGLVTMGTLLSMTQTSGATFTTGSASDTTLNRLKDGGWDIDQSVINELNEKGSVSLTSYNRAGTARKITLTTKSANQAVGNDQPTYITPENLTPTEIAAAPEKYSPAEKAGETDLVNMFKGKKQSVINNEIRALLTKKGTDRNNYSADEIAFLKMYEGDGGLIKEGAKGARILDQFFTPVDVCGKMWGLALKYGFNFEGKKHILEPSVGSGRFLQFIPATADVNVKAFDVDETSYMLCKVLFPDFDIVHGSFEATFFQGNRHIGLAGVKQQYDLVIGNPPYRDYMSEYSKIGEKKATGAETFDQYFIMRGVDVLKKGGVLVMIIPSSFLANGEKYNSFKQELAKKAEFLDAYRLPNGTFGNTQVGTDIIVLRKK